MRWKAALLLILMGILGTGVIFAFASIALEDKKTAPAPETESAGAVREQPFVTFIDPSRGAKVGAHLIVEYGDFSCPYCRAVEKDIERLLAAHPDIRFVWKTVPNPTYPGSENMAEAAECAREQGAFWEYRAQLFAGGGTVTDETGLSLLARSLELDVEAFTACMTSDATVPVIERNVAEARALGIDALPYFFIDGNRMSGQLSYEQLEQALR